MMDYDVNIARSTMARFGPVTLLLTLTLVAVACGSDDGATSGEVMAPGAPADEAPSVYPPGPYGLRVGDIISDQAFVTHEGESESFGTLRQRVGHTLMLVFVTAGWCDRCGVHMPTLIGTDRSYSDQGLFTAIAIYENRAYGAPRGRDAANFRRAYGLQLPVFADVDAGLTRYFDTIEMPMVLVIDLQTMALLYKATGWAPEDVDGILSDAL